MGVLSDKATVSWRTSGQEKRNFERFFFTRFRYIVSLSVYSIICIRPLTHSGHIDFCILLVIFVISVEFCFSWSHHDCYHYTYIYKHYPTDVSVEEEPTGNNDVGHFHDPMMFTSSIARPFQVHSSPVVLFLVKWTFQSSMHIIEYRHMPIVHLYLQIFLTRCSIQVQLPFQFIHTLYTTTFVLHILTSVSYVSFCSHSIHPVNR